MSRGRRSVEGIAVASCQGIHGAPRAAGQGSARYGTLARAPRAGVTTIPPGPARDLSYPPPQPGAVLTVLGDKGQVPSLAPGSAQSPWETGSPGDSEVKHGTPSSLCSATIANQMQTRQRSLQLRDKVGSDSHARPCPDGLRTLAGSVLLDAPGVGALFLSVWGLTPLPAGNDRQRVPVPGVPWALKFISPMPSPGWCHRGCDCVPAPEKPS